MYAYWDVHLLSKRLFLIVLGDIDPISGLSSFSRCSHHHVYLFPSFSMCRFFFFFTEVYWFTTSPFYTWDLIHKVVVSLVPPTMDSQYHCLSYSGVIFILCPTGPPEEVAVSQTMKGAKPMSPGLPPQCQPLHLCFMGFIILMLSVRVGL